MIDYPRLYGSPLMAPAEVQRLLRDPEVQWKKGRSAYEAAHSWIRAGQRNESGLPTKAQTILSKAPEWIEAAVVAGFFEHATPLDTQAGPSNTDLLAVCGLRDELGILAVEAKAGESFGELVQHWNKTEGRGKRLQWACKLFGIDADACSTLRWQLFHRTASAVIEAKRFRASCATMMVHDFSPQPSWIDDYLAFAEMIGARNANVDAVSEPIAVDGLCLRLAWVQDQVTPE